MLFGTIDGFSKNIISYIQPKGYRISKSKRFLPQGAWNDPLIN